MDYSRLIESYIASLGNSSNVIVSQLTDYSYIAEVYYSDEEIETYLGSGSCIILAFNYIDKSIDDAAVGFNVTLEGCKIPGFDITEGNYYDSASGASMGTSLVEEVARAANKFLHSVRINSEVWLSLNNV